MGKENNSLVVVSLGRNFELIHGSRGQPNYLGSCRKNTMSSYNGSIYPKRVVFSRLKEHRLLSKVRKEIPLQTLYYTEVPETYTVTSESCSLVRFRGWLVTVMPYSARLALLGR